MGVLGRTVASPRHRLGPWISALFSPSSLQRGRWPSVAYKCGDYFMSNEHTEAQGARPAQMGCLKFWPAKRALSPSSSSILEERDDSLLNWMDLMNTYCYQLLMSSFYLAIRSMHMISDWTHRSSWLYLAKRSDRQGAPVLIWERKQITFKNRSVR